MPGQQGDCPHCGTALPEEEYQFWRNPGAAACRCRELGVLPGEVPHHACPTHGDTDQLGAAEGAILTAMAKAQT